MLSCTMQISSEQNIASALGKMLMVKCMAYSLHHLLLLLLLN